MLRVTRQGQVRKGRGFTVRPVGGAFAVFTKRQHLVRLKSTQHRAEALRDALNAGAMPDAPKGWDVLLADLEV